MLYKNFIVLGMVCFGLFSMTGMASADASSDISDADQVVVRQGNGILTFADIDAFAATVPEGGAAEVFSSPQRVERMLLNLLVSKQLAQEARELGLDKDPKVQARMRLAAEQALADIRSEVLRQDLEGKVPDMTPLAREQYLADPTANDTRARVDVKHILISTEDREVREAKARAEQLYSELQSDPSLFDAYVERYSDDNSKERNHGLIEDADSSRLVQEFRAAARRLTKEGEISPPVRTIYGYHLIKAVNIVPARHRSFDEAKKDMIPKLEKKWVKDSVRAHVDALRGNELEPEMDRVASLSTRYEDPLILTITLPAVGNSTSAATDTRAPAETKTGVAR